MVAVVAVAALNMVNPLSVAERHCIIAHVKMRRSRRDLSRLLPRKETRQPASLRRTDRHFNRRQNHFDRGTASQFALDLDHTSQFAHDAIYRREAQAGARSELFGGEEGLEQPRPRLCIHAAAAVFYD